MIQKVQSQLAGIANRLFDIAKVTLNSTMPRRDINVALNRTSYEILDVADQLDAYVGIEKKPRPS